MEKIEQLVTVIATRLRAIGIRPPARSVLSAIFRTVQTASLITEEGRFVRGSITYAHPDWFDLNRPSRLRADFPQFTLLETTIPFTPSAFAKVARAVDQWSGSIAIYGDSPRSLQMWGLVDQLVGTNVHWIRESPGGFSPPGELTVIIERPGDFAVYHRNILLAALRAQVMVLKETNVLESWHLFRKIAPSFSATAAAICAALPQKRPKVEIHANLMRQFSDTIARICIGLRRSGAGGSLLITPKPRRDILSISNTLNYDRLRSSMCLSVLDRAYEGQLEREAVASRNPDPRVVRELLYAIADRNDRTDESNGAVKFVTSLAALDGATLLSRELHVIGFGVKIKSKLGRTRVYDGASISSREARLRDLSHFGMRRLSVLSYCHMDRAAIGVIVSQDGFVQIVMTVNSRLWLWDNIQLLRHDNYSAKEAKRQRTHAKESRALAAKRTRHGYSKMPKTMIDLEHLLEHRDR